MTLCRMSDASAFVRGLFDAAFNRGDFERVVDGRIVEHRGQFDLAVLVRQLTS